LARSLRKAKFSTLHCKRLHWLTSPTPGSRACAAGGACCVAAHEAGAVVRRRGRACPPLPPVSRTATTPTVRPTRPCRTPCRRWLGRQRRFSNGRPATPPADFPLRACRCADGQRARCRGWLRHTASTATAGRAAEWPDEVGPLRRRALLWWRPPRGAGPLSTRRASRQPGRARAHPPRGVRVRASAARREARGRGPPLTAPPSTRRAQRGGRWRGYSVASPPHACGRWGVGGAGWADGALLTAAGRWCGSRRGQQPHRRGQRRRRHPPVVPHGQCAAAGGGGGTRRAVLPHKLSAFFLVPLYRNERPVPRRPPLAPLRSALQLLPPPRPKRLRRRGFTVGPRGGDAGQAGTKRCAPPPCDQQAAQCRTGC